MLRPALSRHLVPSTGDLALPPRAVPVLLACACLPLVLLAACDTNQGQPAAPVATSPDITLTVTKPAADAAIGATVEVAGTVTISKGKVSSMVARRGDTTWPVTLSGKNFSFTVDTLQKDAAGKPLFPCNKAAPIALEAKGSNDASASTEVPIQADWCPPVVTLEQPLDGSVHYGKVAVTGKIEEKAFAKGRLYVVRGDGSEQDLALVPAKATLKAGGFKAVLEPSGDTEKVTVRVEVEDNSGNTAEAEAVLTVVREPHFVGDSRRADHFMHDIKDFQLGDANGDGLLDAVVASDKGVFLRLGKPVLDEDGNPVTDDDGKEVPAAEFERTLEEEAAATTDATPADAKQLSTWAKRAVIGGAMSHVRFVDFDHDGDLDVVAVGILGSGKPGAWAVLNQANELKLVDQKELPAEVLSMALADLNVDGQPDLVVGAESDNTGLATVLLLAEPKCYGKGKEAPPEPCGDKAVADVVKAEVFQPKVAAPLHKGVTSITSIAVADFYQDDAKAPDICVGEGERPIVSCYRNLKKDGTLEQAQDSYINYDTEDAYLVVAAEWSAHGLPDDGPDLIIASKKGMLRWLRGNHQGTFTYDPGQYRFIIGPVPTSMTIANLGPGGTPYLVYVTGGRVAKVVPVLPNDQSHRDSCFRSRILGSSVTKVEIADVDQDGKLDFVALDRDPLGLAVSLDKGVGPKAAPDVHNLCAWPEGAAVAGEHEIVHGQLADFTGDKRPELLLAGKQSWSMQQGTSGACPLEGGGLAHKNVWPFHLYVNDGAALSKLPRAGDFAPYATGQAGKSGAAVDCPDSPKPFGSVTGLAVGDFNGDGGLDLVAVRGDSEYTVGTSAKVDNKCPFACDWNEENEVSNLFGLEFPEDGTAARCCRNFAVKDAAKEKVLIGYGNGAPLDRASLFLFIGGDNTKPFGLTPDSTPFSPVLVQPFFAQAAGRNPVDVAVADFNNDNKADVVVLMKSDGSPTTYEYFEARVRLFKGDGVGKLAHASQPDKWQHIDKKSEFVDADVPVNYRVVGSDPMALSICGWGEDKLPGVMTLNKKAGQISVVEALGNMGTKIASHWPVGEAVQAFAVRDIDSDGWCDVLAAVKESIGTLPGQATFFKTKVNLVEKTTDVAAVDVFDANQDGLLDLAVIDKAKWTVQFWLGDGQGAFVPYDGVLRVVPDAFRLTRGDLDGDGCEDMVVLSKFGATVLQNLCPQ